MQQMEEAMHSCLSQDLLLSVFQPGCNQSLETRIWSQALLVPAL